MVARKAAKTVEKIAIPALNMETIQVPIIGIGSLVVHNWSVKAISQMLAKQMGLKLAPTAPKDPEDDYKESLYVATDGSYGFPANGFKSAMVRAVKAVGGVMTDTRQALFVVADCKEDREFVVPMRDPNDKDRLIEHKHRIRTDLVRIIGEPQMRMDMVRLNGGTADVRFRGEFPEWSAVVTVRYSSDMLAKEQIVNLLNRAGSFVGIGEGRPEKSTDMGWGKFMVDVSGKKKGKK